MSDLADRLEAKAALIEMGEKIAWGSDVALMREAAVALRACKGRVKPLEWRATRFFGDDPVKFEAGPYAIECMGFSGKWKVVTQPADGNVKNGIGGYKTFETAAAAAQADHEARILAAIEQEHHHE